jgi:AcrR family transcriptional regulator
MAQEAKNKHAARSAITRQRFIEAAQTLFAERSVDAVSVNEITIAAGQRNRNALQYHFGDRDGLLQAIIDYHGERVNALRQPVLDGLDPEGNSAGNAARALLMPLITYIEQDDTGVHYVKLLSQLAAINSTDTNPRSSGTYSFGQDPRLHTVIVRAIGHLPPYEAQQRLFFMVSMTFHGLADICRAHGANSDEDVLTLRRDLMHALVDAVAAILAAPARAVREAAPD